MTTTTQTTGTTLRQTLRDDFVAKRNGKIMYLAQIDSTHISLAATDGRKDDAGKAGYVYDLATDQALSDRVDTLCDD
jgi:hypothetical protein